jgi:ribosomal protein L11
MTVEITNDISTRLLAQENLLINRAPVQTASFDVKNRILTLPMWQNMTPEIEEMLKAHEVGHAIYTDEQLFAKSAVKHNIPFGFLNCLEDARIEKLMKRKYPGLRKTFNSGYTQLNERDFFGVATRDVAGLELIDRINLWFKVGFKSGVRFSVAEKYLVERAERMESIPDVIAVANAVYEFAKKEKERKRQERENDAEYKKLQAEKVQEDLDDLEELEMEMDDKFDDNDWSSDYTPTDEEPEEEVEETKEMKTRSHSQTTEEKEVPDEIPEEDPFAGLMDSETQRNFAEKLAETADTSTEYVYVKMPDMSKVDVRVPYKTVLAESATLMEYAQREYSTYFAQNEKNYEQFRTDTSRIVNYLIKEFEMKKAASDYKRTSVAKTGVLDVRKLASYKIREDLFKQIQITKDGQKHGMLFTIDWSGSMSDYLEETVKQLISLTTFCYRLKIPFEVYAFSDNVEFTQELRTKNYLAGQQDGALSFGHTFQMIEFLSHKMTNSEFNRACKHLFMMSAAYQFRSYRPEYNPQTGDIINDAGIRDKYQLNGTPLNEGLAWLYSYMGQFKINNQVEKLTMIKLTDGDAGSVNRYYARNEDGELCDQYMSNTEYRYDTKTNERKRIKTVVLLQDDITKKVYTYEPYQCTNLICKLMQDRHGANVVGYHIVGKGRRELTTTVARYGIARNSYEEMDIAMKVRKGFNDEMFFPIAMTGHTEMFLLPNTMKVDEGELEEAMGALTSNQIAKKFGKYLGAKKTSRVLLNRFVAAVA